MPYKDPERKRANDAAYYVINRDEIRARRDPEKARAYAATWAAAHPERVKANGSAWRAANPGYREIWRAANREKVNAYSRKKDPQFQISHAVRARIQTLLRTQGIVKSVSTEEIIGYPLSGFWEYWQFYCKWKEYNLNDKIHHDHIIPLAEFDLTDSEQLHRACHISNIRPLPAIQNLTKRATMPTFANLIEHWIIVDAFGIKLPENPLCL